MYVNKSNTVLVCAYMQIYIYVRVCSYTHLYKYPQGCSDSIPSSSITKNPGHTCFYHSHQTKRRNETISGWEVQRRTFLSVSASVSKCFWTPDNRSKNLLTKKAASALEDRDKTLLPASTGAISSALPFQPLCHERKSCLGMRHMPGAAVPAPERGTRA